MLNESRRPASANVATIFFNKKKTAFAFVLLPVAAGQRCLSRRSFLPPWLTESSWERRLPYKFAPLQPELLAWSVCSAALTYGAIDNRKVDQTSIGKVGGGGSNTSHRNPLPLHSSADISVSPINCQEMGPNYQIISMFMSNNQKLWDPRMFPHMTGPSRATDCRWMTRLTFFFLTESETM